MTENEENKRFEIKDPSESFRELVSDIDAGHDPGDEHRDPPTPKEEVADPPVAADPAPAPVAETSTTQADETAMKETNDYIDEDLASVVKSLVGEISRLKSQASQASQSKKADELVMGLSEEWAPVFKEKANRERLETAVSILRKGYEQSEIPVPDEQEIIQKALRSEFADVKENIEQEQVDTKVRARESQMISRASGRQGRELSPKESAQRSVHKLMIDRGLYNS